MLAVRSLAPAVVALALSVALTGATAAPPADIDDVCARALALIDDGEFDEALQVVDDLRSPAVELRTADDQPLPQSLVPLLDACESERQTALAAAPPADPEPDAPLADFGDSWQDVVDDWLTPLRDSLVVVIGCWFALLVIARLSVFLPGNPWLGRVSPWRRRASLVVGIVLVTLSPPTAVVLLAESHPAGDDPGLPPWQVFAVAVAALGGAVLLSTFFAGRLRMAIQVPDKDGNTDGVRASELIGYLNQIGVVPPQGLEIPRGTDVTALADSGLADATGNTFLAVLQKILNSVLGVTPWLIVLDETDEMSSVIITRNGHPQKAVNITPSEWVFPEGAAFKPLAGKMAAAAVLSTLATRHTEVVGLCGARDWRSIGLHFIGSTDRKVDRDGALEIFGKAIELDPSNFLAEMSHRNVMYREASDEAGLQIYMTWLETQLVDLPDRRRRDKSTSAEYDNVRLRLLLSLISIARNRLALVSGTDTARRKRALVALALPRAAELVRLLADEKKYRQPLHDRMRAIVSISVRAISDQGSDVTSPATAAAVEASAAWFEEAKNSSSPEIAYSLVCYHLRVPGQVALSLSERDDRMTCAFVSARLRDWAPKDPELASVSKKPWFTEILAASTPKKPPQPGRLERLRKAWANPS